MKKILITTLLIFMILTTFLSINYAALTVTEDSLQASFNKYATSNENNEENVSMKIHKTNKKIEFISDGTNYLIDYDLTSKPTFTINLNFTNSMIKEEWENESNKTSLLMVMFALIADHEGIDFMDSMMYMMSSALTDSNMTLIPDTVTNAIEYAKLFYDKENIFEDELFTWTTKKISETPNKYRVQSTLEINNEADFSKIKNTNISFSPSTGSIPTKETADYALTLKVGQTCKLSSKESITSYSSSNPDCIKFSDDYTQITALKPGYSIVYIGINNTFQSFYITVEENITNETLDTITLKINSKTNSSNNNSSSSNNIQESVDKITGSISKLPQTGRFFNFKDGLTLISVSAFIILIIFIITDIKYKNINKK